MGKHAKDSEPEKSDVTKALGRPVVDDKFTTREDWEKKNKDVGTSGPGAGRNL